MTYWNIFLIFPRKQVRQFAWYVKSYFLGNIRKNISIYCLLKVLPRVLSANILLTQFDKTFITAFDKRCIHVNIFLMLPKKMPRQKTYLQIHAPNIDSDSLCIQTVCSVSLLSAWRNFPSLAIMQNAPSEDSDQTAQMCRLIESLLGACLEVCFLMQLLCSGTHWNCLAEVIPLSDNKVYLWTKKKGTNAFGPKRSYVQLW